MTVAVTQPYTFVKTHYNVQLKLLDLIVRKLYTANSIIKVILERKEGRKEGRERKKERKFNTYHSSEIGLLDSWD